MILTEYDHNMAESPHNMAWLGHTDLPKTKTNKGTSE